MPNIIKERINMIKKHLITCSGMLALLLTAKLFIFSKPADNDSFMNLEAASSQKSITNDLYLENLSFANESFPSDNQRAMKKMRAYLRAHSFENLQSPKLHHLAEQWFPIIEPILKKHGIPADFKYMPLVESGFKYGTSPKGAEGYWQFMPNTARDHGLRVNSRVDERHNIEKSTVAAAKYLKSLYREFGSWTLAAAAYNIGEGGLRKQMRNQKQKDYFKIKLNRETASYVYKLISMKEIIENPTRYGYKSKVNIVLAQVDFKMENHFPFEASKSSNTPKILVN